MPFPRSDQTSLKAYLASSRPVDELEPILRDVLNDKYDGQNLLPRDAFEGEQSPDGEASQGEQTKMPAIVALNKGLKIRTSQKQQLQEGESDAEEAVRRLNAMLPHLSAALKEAGVRRVAVVRGGENAKSGRFSYIMAFGAAEHNPDAPGRKSGFKPFGQLVRMASAGEERHYDEEEPPPMLLKPIVNLLHGRVHIDIVPEVRTEGVDERHIAFLDMMATATGYCFDDFHVGNAGLLKGGLPVVLDNGAISSHDHDMRILKEREDKYGRRFIDTNWKLYHWRRDQLAHETGETHYKQIPVFPRQHVRVDDDPIDPFIEVTVSRRNLPENGTLPDDFREWMHLMKMPQADIDSFRMDEDTLHYKFEKVDGDYQIPEKLERNMGQMFLFAQAVNSEIDALYAQHDDFPYAKGGAKLWDGYSLHELEALKDLRYALTSRNRKKIRPLYEKAQEEHLKAFGMEYGKIKDAISDEWLEGYRQRREEAIREENEARRARKSAQAWAIQLRNGDKYIDGVMVETLPQGSHGDERIYGGEDGLGRKRYFLSRDNGRTAVDITQMVENHLEAIEERWRKRGAGGSGEEALAMALKSAAAQMQDTEPVRVAAEPALPRLVRDYNLDGPALGKAMAAPYSGKGEKGNRWMERVEKSLKDNSPDSQGRDN